MQVDLGFWTFPTKKSALEYFQGVLRSLKSGMVIDKDHELFPQLKGLLEHHEGRGPKVGPGIESFYTHDNNGNGGVGFGVIRVDGTRTKFSYKKAINGYRKSDFSRLLNTCRQLVRWQVGEGRQSHFDKHADADGKLECEITRERVTADEAEVDHIYPQTFPVIVRCFFWAKGIDPDQVEVLPSHGESIGTYLPTEELETQFLHYHAEVTRGYLRIVSKRGHRKAPQSRMLRPAKLPVVLQPDCAKRLR